MSDSPYQVYYQTQGQGQGSAQGSYQQQGPSSQYHHHHPQQQGPSSQYHHHHPPPPPPPPPPVHYSQPATAAVQGLGPSQDQPYSYPYESSSTSTAVPDPFDDQGFYRPAPTTTSVAASSNQIPYEYPPITMSQSLPKYSYNNHAYPIYSSTTDSLYPQMYSQPFSLPPQPYMSGAPSSTSVRLKEESRLNNYKPIQTKKNSRPRINKLNKPSAVASKRPKAALARNNSVFREMSLDQMYHHFAAVLKISRPPSFDIANSGPLYWLKVSDPLEFQLLGYFVHSLSKSIDVFVSQDIFSKIVPEIALCDDTNMILNSIFCLSSLMLQRRSPHLVDTSIPIKYYHQSIRSIGYYLSTPGIEEDENGTISRCLLSTILLCIYELLFEAIDSTYVKGATGILSSILYKNRGGQSLLKESPLHETCFWAIIICDLVHSLKYDLSSMYSSEKFWKALDPEYFKQYDRPSHIDHDGIEEEEDISTKADEEKNDQYGSDMMLSHESTMWWFHKSVLFYSTINELNNQVEVISKQDYEQNRPFHDYLELKNKLDEFESFMPLVLKPTIYKPSSKDRIFPIVFFRDEKAAIIALNIKLSKIALYEALLRKTNPNDVLCQQEVAKYPPNYQVKLAEDVIGIMRTYDSSLVIWPVSMHAVRQTVKYFSSDAAALKELENLIHRMVSVCHLSPHNKSILSPHNKSIL